MSRIITTSELQKNIGSLSSHTQKDYTIVTSRGKASVVILPYFEDNDEVIQEYLEIYEIQKNAKKLQKKYKRASQSEDSDLVI